MNIQVFIRNLEQTIAGKRAFLESEYFLSARPFVASVAKDFIEDNIKELEKILADAKKVEQNIFSTSAKNSPDLVLGAS